MAWHGIAQCWSPSSGRSGEEEKQARADESRWARRLVGAVPAAWRGDGHVQRVLPLLGNLGNLGWTDA